MMASHEEKLSRGLVERVLSGLGLSSPPAPSLEGLKTLYAAWCQKVPFDNVRKLIHVQHHHPGPLPGDEATDFFEAWLAYGTGGTCWAGNGALHALLVGLGFSAYRGIATMLVAPHLPPNHATVIVDVDGTPYVVDASILHREPLRLDADAQTGIEHPAWGVHCQKRDGHWFIRWRPIHAPDGLDCRIEQIDVPRQTFRDFHERTRPWSPFNYEAYARTIRGEGVVGLAFGQRVEFDGSGNVTQRRLATAEERRRLLVDELGMSEEIVQQLPLDTPTPPPPWSHAAQEGSA